MSLEGFLLLNKPCGPSSFKMIYHLRKLTDVKKIGHAGTLDPFASGLLLIAIGKKYTKRLAELQKLSPKIYDVQIVLGQTSASLDPETPLSNGPIIQNLSKSMVLDACSHFIGETDQIPPEYSAKHVNGKRSYLLARQGKAIALEPVKVQISDICLQSIDTTGPFILLNIRIACGAGCYIRSFARDLAQKLGTVAYCKQLHRFGIGPFLSSDALNLDKADLNLLQSKLFHTF